MQQFGPLLTKSSLAETECASAFFNRHSITTVDAFGDPALRLLQVGDIIQLERHGFYCVDRPYVSHLVPMVLFMVPGESHRCYQMPKTTALHCFFKS
jgi:glutamyl-tRNA synthetase